jgi:serine/threonine-protein kinase
MPSSGGGNDGYFPTGSVWSKDISKAAKDAQSDTIINWLNQNGGWGTGRMQVDFAIPIIEASSSTPFLPFAKNSGYYTPDCDVPASFPVPAGGAVENNPGYTCSDGGDCHLLVVDRTNHKLYESFQTSVKNNKLYSTCVAIWDLTKNYPTTGRGDQCTSVDAAGFPVAPLLFTPDEIKAGVINHAIRFILPNARLAKGIFVRPATHVGGPSGPSTAVPYGAHFRLKASFNVATLKPGAQVVARALQKYGMFLADGGNIALTAANDDFTKTKWRDVDFDATDLSGLKVTDFEMVDGGTRIKSTGDCVRNP